MTGFDKVLREVKVDLRSAHDYGRTWRKMGDDTGISPPTIAKFARGETTRPAFTTVVTLAEYAGFAVTIARDSFVTKLPSLTQTGNVTRRMQ